MVRRNLGWHRYRYSGLCRCTPEVIGFRPRRNGYVSDRYLSRPVCFVALLRGGYDDRCGRAGRPVRKCRHLRRLRRTAAVRCRRGKRFGFGRGRLKNRNRVRAFRTHPTLGLAVSYRLRGAACYAY